jgi:hypothetical protein
MSKQFTESELEELSLRFRGVLEIDNKIDELSEQTKLFSASKREAIKAIAEKMECKQKEVKKGYDAYVRSLKSPEEVEAEEEVFVIIKEYDLLKQEKK